MAVKAGEEHSNVQSADQTIDYIPIDNNRRRARTVDVPSTNPLRFLERSSLASSSSSSITATISAASPGPWPEGYSYNPPPPASRPRGATLHSAFAFLERKNPASTGPSAIVSGAGADEGLGNLSGGVIAAGAGRDGFLPDWGDDSDTAGILDEDDDDNVCPSMLFSCFPCLACLRPGKRRRSTIDGIKNRSRSQTSLTTPLLTDGQGLPPPEFPKDVKLLEVEVESAKNVPATDMINADQWSSDSGRYVTLRMMPLQEGVGEQIQQTSLARRVVHPRWGHKETFTFFVTDTGASARAFLSICLIHRPSRTPSARLATLPNSSTLDASLSSEATLPAGAQPGDVVLGKGFVDLLGLFPAGGKGNMRRVAVPMGDPARKRRTRCAVMLGIRCRRVNESIDTQEDRLYEYQRWTAVAGWSATGNRDPGKWSTLDGSVFSDTFASVAPPARQDSEVVLPWCPFGGWEYSRGEECPAARLVADETEHKHDSGGNNTSLTKPNLGQEKSWVWSERPGSGGVRRRLWRLVYLDRGSTMKGEL